MAVPSTLAAPSPTAATACVTQIVTAQLLVKIPSLKSGLGFLLATERVTPSRHFIELYIFCGPEKRRLHCFYQLYMFSQTRVVIVGSKKKQSVFPLELYNNILVKLGLCRTS